MRRSMSLLFLLLPAALPAQRAMQPNDWHRVTTVNQPAVS